MQAIQEAIDTFCYRDPREKDHRPFFPLPDELIQVAQDELGAMHWRIEYENRKSFQQNQQILPKKEIIEEPEAIEPHPWEDLTKQQVSIATWKVVNGMTPEAAALAAIEETKNENQNVSRETIQLDR